LTGIKVIIHCKSCL